MRIFSTLGRRLAAGRLELRKVQALERIAAALDRAYPKPKEKADGKVEVVRRDLTRMGIRQVVTRIGRERGLSEKQITDRINEAEKEHRRR